MFQSGPIGNVAIGPLVNITPTSSQSAQFLSRASGLNITWQTAYDTFITGLVNDGVWSKLDVLYTFRSPKQTTANLNLISSSFPADPSIGPPTFTAVNGYTGNGSSAELGTGYTPIVSGTNYLRDSATIGAYISALGSDTLIIPLFNTDTTIAFLDVGASSTNFSYRINDATTASGTGPSSAIGLWTLTRTGANSITLYHNASSFSTDGTASTGIANGELHFLFATSFGDMTIQAGFAGGGFTATDMSKMNSRLNTFLAT